MYILHETSIGGQELHGNYFHEQQHIKLPGAAGLKTILVSADGTKVVMLVSPARFVQIYGAFSRDLGSPKKLHMKERIEYSSDRDNAVFQEDNGSLQLLLTSLERKRTVLLDLDSLFDPGTNGEGTTNL